VLTIVPSENCTRVPCSGTKWHLNLRNNGLEAKRVLGDRLLVKLLCFSIFCYFIISLFLLLQLVLLKM